MAKFLTTDSLIKSVIRRAMLPVSQVTFKEEDFLAFANEELDLGLVPHILSFHEDYFIYPESIPLQDNLVRYPIPHRAMGNKLREVRVRDANGNLYEMTRIFVEDEPYFQYNSAGSGPTTLRTFSVQGNEIVLNISPSSSGITGALEMLYYIRPNEMVSEDRVARVVAVDTTLNKVQVDKVPDAFAGATVFDITSSKNPHKLIAVEIEPTVVANTSNLFFTFAELPKGIQKGDVIALPEETIIPQTPLELHSLLAQRIAMRCLEALGDAQGLQAAALKLQDMELKSGFIIDDRVEGAPKKVNNFHSFLRSSRKWARR